MLNTGTPRSVTGHAISGGLIAALVAGINNHARFRSDRQAAIKDTMKIGLQGAVISAAAIAATNSIGSKTVARSSLEAIGYLSIGAAAAYILERSLSPSHNIHDSHCKEQQ